MIIVSLLLATCAYGQATDDIVGAWAWQSTSYSDGTVETPASIGYSVQLQFSSDMSFLEYHDGGLVEEGVWGIGYVWVEINGGMVHLELIETTTGDRWEPMMTIPGGLLEFRNMSGGTELYVYMGAVSNELVSWGSVKALFGD